MLYSAVPIRQQWASKGQSRDDTQRLISVTVSFPVLEHMQLLASIVISRMARVRRGCNEMPRTTRDYCHTFTPSLRDDGVLGVSDNHDDVSDCSNDDLRSSFHHACR